MDKQKWYIHSCQVTSVMSNSVWPHRRQPTRLPLSLGFSRQEHWSGLLFPSPMHESEKWKWSHSLSHVWLWATPWTAVYQAPPSMGFSKQEYWSGVLEWYIHRVEYYSSIKWKEVLIEAAPWKNPGNIMLSEISQTHNDSYGMTLIICNIYNRQIHRDRNEIRGYQQISKLLLDRYISICGKEKF